ncbi:hypothetical protein MPTK1_5g16600 [Marchantia polymorpha subsp. ruderalis]|uniref:PLAT domain-containing protein n=2 Tax=Marchantia polymorpha TaxID=3197 RepID=A0A176W560_MARPO|nr:hypothetical protein AXG93_492s1110 [Marchantia polymorpha subsp. ruderalis]PTQ30992.1 hypothetical protein MARPO_0117s0046 [Marchantia polymorpha]BBN11991.1 hypothetical protein Mp_5g16600 [Marchantia polymorpha subsp. ruderalis]|eukprot:PTQ30992.1 hypothetical protein MARPO_0117s0046 [Marchantia polymorpha]
MAMSMGTLLLALVFLSATSVLAEDYCVYTVFVKTGWLPKAGTDANIGAAFYDASGNSMTISNFTDWGHSLSSNNDYFERNKVDVFSGPGECLDAPICGMNLTSDGSGAHHGWFSDSVQISAARYGQECSNHYFNVDQWLATDVYPYSLTANRDDCVADIPDQVESARSHIKMTRKVSH